ncbi:hypothetical protein BCR34DRAFT_585946 [Clohesyomyces aquaticus]|uniref:Ser-Thr-rich glycosyl-phosphatidyl-inositol-anchored membrane family-domain-containing protein n=1 Tax=Clohesyomyces aquaticus TaxID=1231657 RepID=A0A1Y1ZVU4_9PLEO|nr:hypothetical protein BCR34DRAFT_585946 [Clohesyomyces aquaticus]
MGSIWPVIFVAFAFSREAQCLSILNTALSFESGEIYTLSYAPPDAQVTIILMKEEWSSGTTLTPTATNGKYIWPVDESYPPADDYHLILRQGNSQDAELRATIGAKVTTVDFHLFCDRVDCTTASPIEFPRTHPTGQSPHWPPWITSPPSASATSTSVFSTLSTSTTTAFHLIGITDPITRATHTPASSVASSSAPSNVNTLSDKSSISTKSMIGVAIGAVCAALVLAAIAFFLGMRFRRSSISKNKISRIYESKPELDGKPIIVPIELPADGPEPQELPVVESPAEIARRSGRQSSYRSSTMFNALSVIESIFGSRTLDLNDLSITPTTRDRAHPHSPDATLSPVSPL